MLCRSDVLSHKVDDQTNSQTARAPIIGSVPGVSMPADKRPGRTLDRNSGRIFGHQPLFASGLTTKLVASWYHSKTALLPSVISQRVSQITLSRNRDNGEGPIASQCNGNSVLFGPLIKQAMVSKTEL